jgi:hypothetical protein
MPEPIELHARHRRACAQPLGEVLPAYQHKIREYQQEIKALQRRVNAAEATTHRLAVQATWMILAGMLIASGITWTIALVWFGVLR